MLLKSKKAFKRRSDFQHFLGGLLPQYHHPYSSQGHFNMLAQRLSQPTR